ncbi:MAG: M20/M25/M40 family metallo-hydrolase, partial [Acidimicrobiaceae bacterium]|nr:M20/M25/M40 family metallo-hydrolase [Acidimicrobiaceae bacterium]
GGVIRVVGEANHAGTTPMAARRDALVAAARVVLAVEALATDGPADVATIGRLVAWPGVVNVVAGEAELTFDVRAADDGRATAAVVELLGALDRIREETRTAISFRALPLTAAVRTDPWLRELVVEAAAARRLPWCELASGAGHDVALLAPLGPVGMIFVPSSGGRSHCVQEATAPDALVAGAEVLLDVLLKADRDLDA